MSMTYCRYSDMDYHCDLQVIAAPDGIVVMTASGRVDESTVPARPNADDYTGVEGRLEWLRVSAEYHEAVFQAQRVKIVSPLAGRMFTFATANEAADFVETSLSVAGFRFPDALVSTLRAAEHAA